MINKLESKVRGLRTERKMSPEELAAKASVSLRTVQSIEGGAMPRVSTALKIADALGVSLDELFGASA